MPTRRHGAPKKQHVNNSATESASAVPTFTTTLLPGTLLTLRFSSPTVQHAALARMEAFYEGATAREAGSYLTLQEAYEARLCRNYQAFNLPLEACRAWLGLMWVREEASDHQGEQEAWWMPYCNEAERQLLTQLNALNALQDNALSLTAPRYLISILASQPASLLHELQHALYFLNAAFRSAAQTAFAQLTSRERKVIQHDLARRGYAESVWPDEFQAYVHENVTEFGNVAKEACLEAKEALKGIRETAMQEEGLHGQWQHA